MVGKYRFIISRYFSCFTLDKVEKEFFMFIFLLCERTIPKYPCIFHHLTFLIVRDGLDDINFFSICTDFTILSVMTGIQYFYFQSGMEIKR